MLTKSIVSNTNNNAAQLRIKLETAVAALLVAQYKATGCRKPEGVLRFIASRIEGLGAEVPFCCVASKRLLAASELVDAALAVIPLLPLVFTVGGKCDGRYVTAIACALSDAYYLACGSRVLEPHIIMLRECVAVGMYTATGDVLPPAQAAEAVAKLRHRILGTLPISIPQYLGLLAAVPLLVAKSPQGNMWLEDKNQPGIPLPGLKTDVRNVGQLLPFLVAADRVALATSMSIAITAINRREEAALVA